METNYAPRLLFDKAMGYVTSVERRHRIVTYHSCTSSMYEKDIFPALEGIGRTAVDFEYNRIMKIHVWTAAGAAVKKAGYF